MDCLEVIRKRRSVRDYTGAPIPRHDLETIVDAARLAASGSNRQPWTFVVITDKDMIVELAVNGWMDKSGALIAVVVDPEASRWWHEDASAAVENMLLAATALGYGSCWMEGQTRPKLEAISERLGIPAERHLVTLVSIGVPATWPDREKKSLDEVLRWERYQ